MSVFDEVVIRWGAVEFWPCRPKHKRHSGRSPPPLVRWLHIKHNFAHVYFAFAWCIYLQLNENTLLKVYSMLYLKCANVKHQIKWVKDLNRCTVYYLNTAVFAKAMQNVTTKVVTYSQNISLLDNKYLQIMKKLFRFALFWVTELYAFFALFWVSIFAIVDVWYNVQNIQINLVESFKWNIL